MDGTDNMMFVTKMWDCGDTEMHECVVHTMVSVVSSCFEQSVHRRDSLDARVMDRLCTANAPTIIVSELKNRRVTSIGKPQYIVCNGMWTSNQMESSFSHCNYCLSFNQCCQQSTIFFP